MKSLLRERDAELARVRATASSAAALIAHLQLSIEKLRRELYGVRSERKARLLEQMELELEELEADAAEDDLAAEREAETAKLTTVGSFSRKKPSRKPFPAHLPRERVVLPGPTCCACCGSTRLHKLGEDVTETLEAVPRQWKVVQHVREKFSCRECEKISQAPAPFHPLPRGLLGPSLLAMILFEKYGQHQPLNRQSTRYGHEGVELSLSTLADQVGGCALLLRPLYELIRDHVFVGARVHGDDTTVPVLAKGKNADWTVVDLCARRQALRRRRSASGGVLLLARSRRANIAERRSRQALAEFFRPTPMPRLQPALCAGPVLGADHGSRVLEPREAQVLRARGHRRQCAQ